LLPEEHQRGRHTVTITLAEAAACPRLIAARKRMTKATRALDGLSDMAPLLEQATNAVSASVSGWRSTARAVRRISDPRAGAQASLQLAQLHGSRTFRLHAEASHGADGRGLRLSRQGEAAAAPLQAKEFAELRAEKAKLDGTRWLPQARSLDIDFLKERAASALQH